MFVYQIVNQVQQAHRGLCTRLAERRRKSKQYFQSHGVEPFTVNPESYGKPSDADQFVEYCEEYEASSPGAGLMLSELIAAELRARFTAPDTEICQREMRREVFKETTEALLALDECDFEDATVNKLQQIQFEVQEMVNKGALAVGHIQALIRQRELSERFNRQAVSTDTREKVRAMRGIQ